MSIFRHPWHSLSQLPSEMLASMYKRMHCAVYHWLHCVHLQKNKVHSYLHLKYGFNTTQLLIAVLLEKKLSYRRDNARRQSLRQGHSSPQDVSINRKPVWDFLLVNSY